MMWQSYHYSSIVLIQKCDQKEQKLSFVCTFFGNSPSAKEFLGSKRGPGYYCNCECTYTVTLFIDTRGASHKMESFWESYWNFPTVYTKLNSTGVPHISYCPLYCTSWLNTAAFSPSNKQVNNNKINRLGTKGIYKQIQTSVVRYQWFVSFAFPAILENVPLKGNSRSHFLEEGRGFKQ